MPKGGYRPGAGRPRGLGKISAADFPKDVIAGKKSPLEYMISVINDPKAEKDRRDRMAIAAAPYVHGKAADADTSKAGERKARAKATGVGRFATPPPPPKLVVVNE